MENVKSTLGAIEELLIKNYLETFKKGASENDPVITGLKDRSIDRQIEKLAEEYKKNKEEKILEELQKKIDEDLLGKAYDIAGDWRKVNGNADICLEISQKAWEITGILVGEDFEKSAGVRPL